MKINKPDYVLSLEEFYGPPSQEAFGSAVFFALFEEMDLEIAALEKYRSFIGDLWERYGEDAWMGSWRQIYCRGEGQTADIIQELKGIEDFLARSSVSMILEGIEDRQGAQRTLKVAFDDPAVNQLAVYSIGDGEAMSGILIAAWRKTTAEATFLIFLMD